MGAGYTFVSRDGLYLGEKCIYFPCLNANSSSVSLLSCSNTRKGSVSAHSINVAGTTGILYKTSIARGGVNGENHLHLQKRADKVASCLPEFKMSKPNVSVNS